MASTQTLTELPIIQYTGMDYQSVISQIQEIISSNDNWKENWTQFYNSEAGTMLVQLMAWICDNLAVRQDMIYNEQFLATANSSQSKLRLLNQIGYKQRTTSSSMVKIEVVPKTLSAYDIVFSNNYSSISNVKDSILSFSAKDINGKQTDWEVLDVNTDGSINYLTKIKLSKYKPVYTTFYDGKTTKELYAVQGKTNYLEQISATENGPVFSLGVNDFDLKTLEVFQKSSGTDVPLVHKRVDNFLDLSKVDEGIPCYVVEKADNGYWQIRYPWKSIVENNYKLEGHLYPKGETISIFFRTSNGSTGNIAEGVMKYNGVVLSENNEQIDYTISNIDSGYNGKNGETLEEAVKNAPLSIMTMNRAVTTDDYDRLLKGNNLVANCVSYSPANMPSAFKNWYGRKINPQEVFTFITLNKNYQNIPSSELNHFPWVDLVKEPVINEQYSMYDGNSNLKLNSYLNYDCVNVYKDDNESLRQLKNISVFKTTNDIKYAVNEQIEDGTNLLKIKCHSEESTSPHIVDIYNDFIDGYESLTINNSSFSKDTYATYISDAIQDEYIDCLNYSNLTIVFDENLELEIDLKCQMNEIVKKINEAYSESEEFTKNNFTKYYLKLDNEVETISVDGINANKGEIFDVVGGEIGAEKRKGILQIIRDKLEEAIDISDVESLTIEQKEIKARLNGVRSYRDIGLKFPENALSYSDDFKMSSKEIAETFSPVFIDYSNYNDGTGVSEDDYEATKPKFYAVKLNGKIYCFQICPARVKQAKNYYKKYYDGSEFYDKFDSIFDVNGDDKKEISTKTAQFEDTIGDIYSNTLIKPNGSVEALALSIDRLAIYLEYLFSSRVEEGDFPLKVIEEKGGKFIIEDFNTKKNNLGIRFSLCEKDYFDSNSDIKTSFTYEDGKCFDIRIDSKEDLLIESLTTQEISNINKELSFGDEVTTGLDSDDIGKYFSNDIDIGSKPVVEDFFTFLTGKERKYEDKKITANPENAVNIIISSEDNLNPRLIINSFKTGEAASLYFSSIDSDLGLIGKLGLSSAPMFASDTKAIYKSTKSYGRISLELYKNNSISNGEDIAYIDTGDILFESNNINNSLEMYISYILNDNNTRIQLDKQENYYGEAPEITGILGQVVTEEVKDGEIRYVIDKKLSDFDVRLTSETFNGYSFYQINENNLTNPKLNVIKCKRASITTANFEGVFSGTLKLSIDDVELVLDAASFKNPLELRNLIVNTAKGKTALKKYANMIATHKYQGSGVTISSVNINGSITFYKENDSEMFKTIFGTNKTNPEFYALYPKEAIAKINGVNDESNPFVIEVNEDEYYYSPYNNHGLKFVFREFTSDNESRFGDYYITCEGNSFGNYSFYLNRSEFSEFFPDGKFYVHFINDRTYSKEADKIEENVIRNYMSQYMIAGTELNLLRPYFRTFNIKLKVIYNPNYNEQELRKKIKSAIENKFKIVNLNNINAGTIIYRSDIDRLVLGIEGVLNLDLKYFGYDKNDQVNYPSQSYALTTSANGVTNSGEDFYIINILGDFGDDDITLERSGVISINN